MFVQDGDRSQNCKTAYTALDKDSVVQFTIHLHTTYLNHIENAFNLVEKKLSNDGVKYSIPKDSYAKFVERVAKTLWSNLIDPIDKIIKSMPKKQFIQSSNHCLKN